MIQLITTLHPSREISYWLAVTERTKLHQCFHAINGSGFSYLAELVHLYTASGTFRSISSDSRIDKIIQYKRKTRGFRFSSCFRPYIWNSLPSWSQGTVLNAFVFQNTVKIFPLSFLFDNIFTLTKTSIQSCTRVCVYILHLPVSYTHLTLPTSVAV